ncbi:NLPA lipofamily protein, partial [Chlamydia psittaci 84-8471/1]
LGTIAKENLLFWLKYI